jgi:DNA polymerase III subunit epsilon
MLEELSRRWRRHRLKAPEFAPMFERYRGDELVSLDCETTGLDPRKAEILSVGAMRIKGDAILTSQRLEVLVQPTRAFADKLVTIHQLRPLDVAQGLQTEAAIRRVLEFIGPRPLVGYFLSFDVAMLSKYACPLLGTGLPNKQIEVSRLYYEWRAAQLPPGSNIDLSFESIRTRLDLPEMAAHDAVNDALLTAMMYLRLRGNWRAGASRG